MKQKKVSRLFKVLKRMLRWVYPTFEAVNAQNMPDEPCIIVGNHSQVHGPIACELYFPRDRYTWCVGKMLHKKEVPDYAFEEFWSGKPKRSKWFFNLAAKCIGPLSQFIMGNANTIGVYDDTRIMSTFKSTLAVLDSGQSIVIFPEKHQPYNNIICDFERNFVDVARLYYKKTGKQLQFVPMYVAPRLKKFYFGSPICFCHENDPQQEKERICGHIMGQITDIARALPEHTVVPYENLPKKQYPSNKDHQ